MNREKMIVLRTFSNEMFARMAAMHLENLEIKSLILKDDAGGAYPSMQFSEGVRLLIDPGGSRKGGGDPATIGGRIFIRARTRLARKFRFGLVHFFLGIFSRPACQRFLLLDLLDDSLKVMPLLRPHLKLFFLIRMPEVRAE